TAAGAYAGSGISRLSPGRKRGRQPALVFLRPAAPDRTCLVAEPSITHGQIPQIGRRPTMIVGKSIKLTIVSVIACAALAVPSLAAPPNPIDLAAETAGAEPKAFVPVVGFWRIEDDNGKKVLVVDGRQWKEGQSSAGIADKARALYGERYAEFLDRVQ